MNISDSQLIMATINLLSSTIKSPDDLEKINKEHIQTAIKIAQDVAENIPSLDINNQNEVTAAIERAFEFLGKEEIPQTMLVETIRQAERIGRNAAWTILQCSADNGILKTINKPNSKAILYRLDKATF